MSFPKSPTVLVKLVQDSSGAAKWVRRAPMSGNWSKSAQRPSKAMATRAPQKNKWAEENCHGPCRIGLCTEMLLHAFTHKSFKQSNKHVFTKFWLTHADHTFTLRYFLRTDVFFTQHLHTQSFYKHIFCTQKLLHADAFTPDVFTHKKSISTQVPLHGDAFTHRSFYTRTHMSWHTEVFTNRFFYTDAPLHTCFCTQKFLHAIF